MPLENAEGVRKILHRSVVKNTKKAGKPDVLVNEHRNSLLVSMESTKMYHEILKHPNRKPKKK